MLSSRTIVAQSTSTLDANAMAILPGLRLCPVIFGSGDNVQIVLHLFRRRGVDTLSPLSIEP
ncbi:Hypothetical protein FKW44_007723 [Caligus rogercresseyi]|uniref:Uncharacterized protein n=1 Tax=Caligus rogercresseyi TaxID=217165 RepID=A0A7T8KF46_CALRO|nr:Hypothetical protein FKW44_007723 [Caligus rogercresseyi]